jgi:aminopeptidase N
MFVIFLFLQIALSVVVPVEYVLELDVSMERLQYTGNVTIKVRAMSETQNITMDSRSTVTEVRCTMHLEKWKKYSDSVSIYLKKPMIAGQEEEIFLSFSGLISMNSTSGFYASLSKDILAITQFETHGASTVFPCFDDPDLKAHFKLQVAVEEPFVVLGNMEVEKFKILDKVVYRFQKTPKISTYLVAW